MVTIRDRASRVALVAAGVALLAPAGALGFSAWSEGTVGSGGIEELTHGFVVESGNGRTPVLVYAVASSVNNISDPLADPRLILRKVKSDGSRKEVDRNDDWADHPSADAVARAVESFNANELDAEEAALIARLKPGTYEVIASAASGSGTVVVGAAIYDGGGGPGGGDPGVQGGLWTNSTRAYDVCLNVAADGSKLTRTTLCDDQRQNTNSFDIQVEENGWDSSCPDDDGNMNFDDDVPIKDDGSFSNEFDVGGGWAPNINLRVEGRFDGNRVTGTFYKTIFGQTCTVDWEASPGR